MGQLGASPQETVSQDLSTDPTAIIITPLLKDRYGSPKSPKTLKSLFLAAKRSLV
jgi:hypothetical protein